MLENDLMNLYNLELVYIWKHTFDEGTDNELILDTKSIYIECESIFIKISDNQENGNLIVKLVSKMDYMSDNEAITYKVDVSNLILNYSENKNYIKRFGGINIKKRNDCFICDAISIHICTNYKVEQQIFIHTGLFGLKIGSIDKKNHWVQNVYLPLHNNTLNEEWFF